MQASHAQSGPAVAAALGVDPALGLTSDEATARLRQYGPNLLDAPRTPSLWAMVWDAVSEPFVIMLAIAGLLAVAVGEVRDGLLVLIGLLPIVGADVITGYRGERALEALRDSTAPMARLRRDGRVQDLPATDVVPGDVVLIAAGDVVPADLRLLRADALLIDRSVLTGESVPESGSIEPDAADAAIVDQRAIAFGGSRVIEGRGEGVVVATGPRSRLGSIASSLGGQVKRRSPIQLELDRLVRILLGVAIVLIVITSGLALLRHEPIGVALLAGVAAAIAAIPEEPPILLAVILGLGAYRLLRRGVLVRRLSAQETLSAVDLILTDKTGTLTVNRLGLEAVYTPREELDQDATGEVARLALRAQDDAWRLEQGARAGSFTYALERWFEAFGSIARLDPAELLECDPISTAHPYTRTLSRSPGGNQELVMGAPEVVLGLVETGSRAGWAALADAQAEAGRRLLLLARGDGRGVLELVALLAFSDPLRDDVGAALGEATLAGIQIVVVTGDHPRTAARIAAQAGLADGLTVTGEDLAGWDDERLARELPNLRVVARALPEQKLRLVEAARRAGRTVAVTGDGVNDAPALEHADVAIAMGSGAAVAREASDMVLGDDSFSTLLSGLREGRRMVANIQKGLVFLVSTHVALLGFVLIATLYGFSQPLLPIHILWLELFIDISASIAFEREPAEPDLMRQPPRPRGRPLLSRSLLLRITVAGGWTALGALFIIATHPGGFDHARWVAFNALVVGQIVRAYANRSLTMPVLSLSRNSVLLVAAVVALAAQVAIPYVPFLADAFRAAQLDLGDWLLVAVVALVPAALAEFIRAVTRRTWVA